MLLIALLPPKFYNNLSISCFILGLLSLLFVKFFGQGSVQRWISFGGFNLQPSEPIKLALILVLAKYFHNISKVDLQKTSTFLLPIIFILLPGIFVITQPDLGTGLAIILLGIAILFYIGTVSYTHLTLPTSDLV